MKNKDFIGDDNINWSSHAREEVTKGNYFTDVKAFDYFSDLVQKGALCLDAGCSIGRWAPIFKKLGWEYLGVDSSEEAITIALKKFPELEFKVSKLENLGRWMWPKSFDLIFTNSVLQHIHNENKKKILKGFHTILVDDGILVLQENKNPTSRSFSEKGWIEFIEPFGFVFLLSTPKGDTRNGMVFRKEVKK